MWLLYQDGSCSAAKCDCGWLHGGGLFSFVDLANEELDHKTRRHPFRTKVKALNNSAAVCYVKGCNLHLDNFQLYVRIWHLARVNQSSLIHRFCGRSGTSKFYYHNNNTGGCLVYDCIASRIDSRFISGSLHSKEPVLGHVFGLGFRAIQHILILDPHKVVLGDSKSIA